MPDLIDELAALATMSPAQLRAEWRRVHRTAPPPFTPELLLRGIAYRLQERVHGGVSAKTVRAIRRLAEQNRETAGESIGKVNVKPGTRLVRSWNGTTYSVLVTNEGFMLDGKRFKSLSQVAQAITGVHWSGPRFFGVQPATPTTGAAAKSAGGRTAPMPKTLKEMP